MPDLKISEFTAQTAMTGTDVLPLATVTPANRKITWSNILVDLSSYFAALVSGAVPVNKGGTAQTTYTNGQLLIGNTTGNTLTKATLTAGSGITVTNGSGAITIAASSMLSYGFTTTMSANQSAAGEGFIKLAFNTVGANPGGGFNTSTNRYTIPVTGYYQISVSVFKNSGTTTQCASFVQTGTTVGSNIILTGVEIPSSSAAQASLCSGLFYLTAGTEVSAITYVATGTHTLNKDKMVFSAYFIGA